MPWATVWLEGDIWGDAAGDSSILPHTNNPDNAKALVFDPCLYCIAMLKWQSAKCGM